MKNNCLLICACLCLCCVAQTRTFAKAVEGESSDIEINDSKLRADNHPRVIFTDEDFAYMAKLYAEGTNPYFNSMHDAIITRADKSIGARDVRRVMLYPRLLGLNVFEMRVLCCAYAYKTTGDAKYLVQAEHDLRSICNFEDWNHATHGLDVGELSISVGLCYDWLYNDLSDETKEMMRTAINDFALVPYLTGTANDPIYTQQFNNHNQVVNAGLVCGALAVYEDNEAAAREIIEKAVKSNIIAQKMAYSPDGNCREGYTYYTYGTIFETTMLTAMETVLGTDYGLSDVEGFEESPQYMIFMDGPSGRFFNYLDCDKVFNMPCVPLWYFAWKYGDMSALYLEKDKYGEYADEPRLMPVIAWYASKVNVDNISAPAKHIYYGRGPVPVVLIHDTWTMDENDKFLGIKGGAGNTPHGHLDAGSFVFDAEGVRWAADLGGQDYSKAEAGMGVPEFWSYADGSPRWTVFRYHNRNHNTLTVNDSDHLSNGFVPITDYFYDENGKKGATVDLTAPLGNRLASAVRTIYIEGDDLVVEDSLKVLDDEDVEVRWTLVSMAEPTIENGGVTLTIGDKTRYLTSTCDVDWAVWNTVGDHDWDEDNSDFYECGYTTNIKAGTGATITVRLSLQP